MFPSRLVEFNRLNLRNQMFVGNEQKVYIMDKVENNAAQIDQHPAWAVEWLAVTLIPCLRNQTELTK